MKSVDHDENGEDGGNEGDLRVALLYKKLRQLPVSIIYEPINLVVLPVFYSVK